MKIFSTQKILKGFKKHPVIFSLIIIISIGFLYFNQDNSNVLNEVENIQTANFDDVNKNSNLIEVDYIDITDGDTFSIYLNDKKENIRLIGVDTPEKEGYRLDENSAFSVEATDFSDSLLKQADNIYIEYEKNTTKKDKYDRVLAYVFIRNGDEVIFLNETLLENGYASAKYLSNDYKYSKSMFSAEKNAYNNNLNIWSIDGYVDYETHSFNY